MIYENVFIIGKRNQQVSPNHCKDIQFFSGKVTFRPSCILIKVTIAKLIKKLSKDLLLYLRHRLFEKSSNMEGLLIRRAFNYRNRGLDDNRLKSDGRIEREIT